MSVRALIVDDEPLCRERVRALLSVWPQVEVGAECAFAADAVQALNARSDLDLLFLDVQMPDGTGFDVIERAGLEHTPLVIFVTAYADYAVDAFEVHAFDYLLKPIEAARFNEAVGRALRELAAPGAALRERLGGLLRTVRPSQGPDAERLLVRNGTRLVFVNARDVDWFEASGNYVSVHVGREVHLMRQTMVGLESRLDAARFARIHRRALVNLDAIRELRSDAPGDRVAVLRNGERLPVSRRCRQRIEAAFAHGRR